MECINHPGTPAAGTCQVCGKALCAACMNRFDPPVCEPCLTSHNASVARRLYLDEARREKALVVGVCSRGQVGKGYLIGKRTDLTTMLGTGPLVDRVRDILATGGQEPVLIAVPAQGQAGGYISPVSRIGTGADAQAPGFAGGA